MLKLTGKKILTIFYAQEFRLSKPLFKMLDKDELLTFKALITTAVDDKFGDIFPIFEKK